MKLFAIGSFLKGRQTLEPFASLLLERFQALLPRLAHIHCQFISPLIPIRIV
jgi:hypothetical protein